MNQTTPDDSIPSYEDTPHKNTPSTASPSTEDHPEDNEEDAPFYETKDSDPPISFPSQGTSGVVDSTASTELSGEDESEEMI